MDLWSDMERDMWAYCSPLVDPPPREEVELLLFVVLPNTTVVTVPDFENYLLTLEVVSHAACSRAPSIKGEEDCLVKVTTRHAASACEQLKSSLLGLDSYVTIDCSEPPMKYFEAPSPPSELTLSWYIVVPGASSVKDDNLQNLVNVGTFEQRLLTFWRFYC